MRISMSSLKLTSIALSALILAGFFIQAEAHDSSTAFENMIPGCTNLEACNYNPDATSDDGSCLFWDECGECGGTNESGCTDPQAVNYDSTANCNSGTCAYCTEVGTSFDPVFFDNYVITGNNEWVAQVFTCENTIYSPNFGLLLEKCEAGTGVTLEIYTTTGGIPNFGDDPIDVTYISDAEIPMRADGCSLANFGYVFAPGEATLVAGQPYALVCKSDNDVSWRISTTELDGIDPYPFGDAMTYQPNEDLGDPQLNIFEDHDLGFTICERAMSEDWGCTDSTAENFNPTALLDDGSCEFQARSLYFDGEDDYIVIPADATTDFSSSDFSVEGWIKIDTSVSFSAPISAFDFDLGGWALEVYYQKIRFMHGNTGLEGDFDYVTCIDSLDLNVWYHIAAVRQGNELRMYIDGNLQGTTISNRIIPYPNMLLGRLYTNTNTFYYPGCVDEVRLWNFALTEEEVMASMQCELAGDETGLVRYYRLNQGLAGADNSSVTTLESDHVNNPVDGTLLNFTLLGPTSNWVFAPLSGQCAVGCPGDFNDDQEVSTPDLLILLGGIGCTESPCIGDLNNSGTTDTADLLLFLALFGTSC